MEKVIYGIGHGTKTLDEFLMCVKKNEITVVVDVRTYPSSKYCPQFNKENFSKFLETNGVKYIWRGKALGGLGRNVGFDDAIDELMVLVGIGERVCVCCSETSPEKCHRHTMLEPKFREKGFLFIDIDKNGNPSYNLFNMQA